MVVAVAVDVSGGWGCGCACACVWPHKKIFKSHPKRFLNQCLGLSEKRFEQQIFETNSKNLQTVGGNIYLEYLVGPFFGPLRHLTKYFSRFGILSV